MYLALGGIGSIVHMLRRGSELLPKTAKGVGRTACMLVVIGRELDGRNAPSLQSGEAGRVAVI